MDELMSLDLDSMYKDMRRIIEKGAVGVGDVAMVVMTRQEAEAFLSALAGVPTSATRGVPHCSQCGCSLLPGACINGCTR